MGIKNKEQVGACIDMHGFRYECRNAVGNAQEVIPEGGLGFLLYS